MGKGEDCLFSLLDENSSLVPGLQLRLHFVVNLELNWLCRQFGILYFYWVVFEICGANRGGKKNKSQLYHCEWCHAHSCFSW